MVPFQLVMRRSSPSSSPYEHASAPISVSVLRPNHCSPDPTRPQAFLAFLQLFQQTKVAWYFGSHGFVSGNPSYYPSPNPQPRPETEVIISPDSSRLELLQPFQSHFEPQNPRGNELPSLRVLMRVRGKCTTDHISAAVGLYLIYGSYHLLSCVSGPVVEVQGSSFKYFRELA